MRPRGSQPPRLYGLAKVHKTGTPLRPVLSMPGSAYFKIASKVAFWLSHVPECRINSSTKTICDSLRNVKLEEDEELVSFDVISLYTNVPVKEAIQVAADLIFNGKNPQPPVDKETFIKLAEVASCDVIMLTHNGFYKQVDGLAMGSPPAPHLANAWMSQFDSAIRGNSKLYSRYMDDIFCDKKRQNIAQNLNEANKLHPALGLTMEREHDGSLPMLDMEIRNDNGHLSSTWYSKPSSTGLLMNYHALAPKRYKRSVVSGMVHRIYRSCSNWKNIHESLERAKKLLIMNQYPPSFFEPIINTTLTKIIESTMELTGDEDDVSEFGSDVMRGDDDSKNDDEDVAGSPMIVPVHNIEDKHKFRLFVQYRGKCSDQYARALHNIQAPCRVIMTLRKLKTVLPSLKPPVEWSLRSDVIYQITCPRCKVRYVGQTDRHLLYRFKEHRDRPQPVKQHFSSCNIRVREEDIVVIGSSNKSVSYLRALEALYIRELQPFINSQCKNDDYNSRKLRIMF